MKKNTRVSFVCGKRVLDQLGMRKNVLSNVARQLSVPEEHSAEALLKVLNGVKATEKALEDAQNKLLEYEAKELAANCKDGVIAAAYKDRTIQDLQKLGRAITAQNSMAVALFVADNDDKLQFIAARGANIEKV